MSGPDAPYVIPRLETGVPQLDAIFDGGLPTGVITVIAGAPGTGKTTLAQQMCFHHAARGGRVLYFNTLSEPTAKTLLHLRPFAFFVPEFIEERIRFIDLGLSLRTRGLELTCNLLIEQLKLFKPSMVVIDSFKVFDDLAQSAEELRKFTYELAVRLMAWECTTFLLGEYNATHFEHPAYSAIDGILVVKQQFLHGEQQRLLQVVKMRGTRHSHAEHAFIITPAGIEVYAPSLTLRRTPRHTAPPSPGGGPPPRLRTGVSQLDLLLGEGIPLGASVIVSGAAGTGKTVLGLEFVYRGAREHGQRGVFFSFEQTEQRLLDTARALGWELDQELARGRVRIVFIAQPDILVDRDLLRLQHLLEDFDAQRVVLDSMSVFLHRLEDARLIRDKVYWLASIIQNQQAVGLFTDDLPSSDSQRDRQGVKETTMDGLVLLGWEAHGHERHRYLEVNKLRNTAHATGRHALTIGPGGLQVFPRLDGFPERPPPRDALAPRAPRERLSIGVPWLDSLLGGGLRPGGLTLVSGSPGTGKSTLGIQFALEAARRGERSLFCSLVQDPRDLLQDAAALGLPLIEAVASGHVRLLHLTREHLRFSRLLFQVEETLHQFEPSRLVLDCPGDVGVSGAGTEEPRRLLHGLVHRLSNLGVTSLLTLESRALLSTEPLDEQGLTPLADNLLLLRYHQDPGGLVPTLTVVKTRGSDHDRSRHRVRVARGGLQQVDAPPARSTWPSEES